MITNKPGSRIKEHADISFPNNHSHYYISNVNLVSNSKNEYLNYVNLLSLNCFYNMYCLGYWVEKDMK